MSRSSAHRAQTEPLAALAAVFAVGIALSLYAGSLPEPAQQSDDAAETTLSAVYHDISRGGAVVPGLVANGSLDGPAGHDVNLTLEAGPASVRRGPPRPPGATNATRSVGVRTAPGQVRVARLTVGVWT